MPRVLKDWLPAFLKFTDHMEAPRHMRFWAGASAIGGALRKKVWIDQDKFIWTPGMYVIFVGPPGVITKSTTVNLGMDLLREVPGIKFGPDNITWQALVGAFASANESFMYGELQIPMSPITLGSSELGSLVDPKNQDMVNLFIELWDGKKTYEKVTKTSGDDSVEAPWINLLGATTPSWIADNMPASAVGGGFVSRCVFLYGDRKDKYVAYLKRHKPADNDRLREELINDLTHIAENMVGEYILTEEAYVWGEKWYEAMWKGAEESYDDMKIMGAIARKQTHVHKLAMIIAASKSDDMIITAEDLQLAEVFLRDVEKDMPKIFSRIGRTEDSMQTERFIAYIKRKGEVEYGEAYQQIHTYFPDFRDFEGIVSGCVRAGYLAYSQRGDKFWLSYVKAGA